MAKSKKMTDEELLKPLPALVQPKKDEVVFPSAKDTLAAQKDFLKVRLATVLKMEMTDENIEKVRVIKRGIVGWRNAFDKQCKDYIKAVYKAPMDVFKVAADAVMDDIAKMESQCDEILDKEEAKRRENVNTVLDGLIEDLEAEFGIKFPDVERKKNYYNKSADMKAVSEDLREQFKAKASEIRQREADKKMIERACDDERLNRSMYLDMLAYEPASVIIEKIEAEKERLNKITAEAEVEDSGAAPEEEAKEPVPAPDAPVQIGVKVDPDKFRTDFPGLLKEMVLEIKYPVDVSDELTRIFGELQKAGVKMRVISKKEPPMPVF